MKKNLDLIIYSALTLVFAILVQVLDWGDMFGIIKIACIGCNLLFGIYYYYKNKSNILIVFGLLFTLIADSFISSFGDLSTARMSASLTSFFFVQLCYITLLNKENIKTGNMFIVIRIILIIIFTIIEVIILKNEYSYMIFIGNLYIVNLLISVFQSFISKYQYKTFSYGLLAFILCDIFVAFQTGVSIGMIPFPNDGLLRELVSMRLDWIFYNIAQYLIVLTLRHKSI